MKICSKCGLEKDESEFSIRKERPCGLISSCKSCQRNRSKIYHSSKRGQLIRKRYQSSEQGKLSQKLGQKNIDKQKNENYIICNIIKNIDNLNMVV